MTNFFQRRRDELGLTQRNIAESFDPPLTPAAVSAWENELATPNLSQATKLAEIYRVSESKIINEIAQHAKRVRANNAA